MNKIEEAFYAKAAEEVASKKVATGIMAKAYSDTNGDEKKSIALYIKLRVNQLTFEYNESLKQAEKTKQEEINRKKNEEQRKNQNTESSNDNVWTQLFLITIFFLLLFLIIALVDYRLL